MKNLPGRVGEDTREILHSLGYEEEALKTLKQKGVVDYPEE